MQKVMVIGCPGSGKSTFAKKLAEKTGLPLCHLDLLNWRPDGSCVPHALFEQRLAQVIEQRCWIIDGNYGRTLDVRFRACDTVFFLDYATDVCLAGILARRGQPRSDMPWIAEPEGAIEELTAFVRAFRGEPRAHILTLLAKYPERQVYRFAAREESEVFLRRLADTGSGGGDDPTQKGISFGGFSV